LPVNFHLSAEVDKSQTYQRDRTIDQSQIVSKRLGRQRLETNIDKRAESLLKIVNQHINQDLRLAIYSSHNGHALYIRKNSDGGIQFFDPNYGLYDFNNDEDFSKFYQDLHYQYASTNNDMPIYELQALTPKEHEAPQGLLSQLSGKVRTFLTGTKHDSFLGFRGVFMPVFNKLADNSADNNALLAQDRLSNYKDEQEIDNMAPISKTF